MGPRPYSENSTLPELANNEPLTSLPTQILTETPTSSSITSSGTTPSPTPQEIIPVEQHNDAVVIQDDSWGNGTIPFYPELDEVMPYDLSLPDFIRQISNQTNLANLQSLSLRVISTCISLHRMSIYLPNLRELDLEGSVLNSLRDIGCNFKNLQILKVGRCQLESLDGTFGLATLRELYAEKNLINDVSPCSNLPHIRHIDVSWNRIRNISYAGFLSVCSKLKTIAFTGNPATEVANYRGHVRRILPQIEVLDGVPFSNDSLEKCKEPEFVNTSGNESDNSDEILDFYSVSPSYSNFLDLEEDLNLNVKCKTKDATYQDEFDAADSEISRNSLLESKSKVNVQDDSKILSAEKTKGVLERPKATIYKDNRNIDVELKCTSIQTLDKTIQNRSKKPNFLLQSKYDEDRVSLPEIVPGTSNFSLKTTPTLLQHTESMKIYLKSEMVECEGSELDGIKKSSDDVKSGTIKKKFSPTPSLLFSTTGSSGIPSTENAEVQLQGEGSDMSEKNNVINALGTSSLSSGLPVRGNLTAALRNRNKQQEGKEFLQATIENLQEASSSEQIASSKPSIKLQKY